MSKQTVEGRIPKTALHLIGALAAVVALSAAMLVMTLVTLSRLEAAEQEVAHLDRAKHAAHIVEAQVREQYIHQTHSIIEQGLTHLDHYRKVVQTTDRAIARLQKLTRLPEDRQKAGELARLAQRNDLQFREQVVPAIQQGRGADLVQFHAGQMEPLLRRVTRANAELSEILNGRSAEARARATALREKTRAMALIFFGLALFVAIVVAVVLTRRIGGRILALRNGALRLARGDLDTRITLSGQDEFVQLAETFNRMAGDLRDHQQRLVQSERLASIGQVAAGVAHEINNPLAVILGYAKVLRKRLAEEHAEVVQIIEDETRNCQRIVDDLLELARPQNLSLGRVDLLQVARDVAKRLADAGKVKEAQLVWNEGAAGSYAWADEEKVKQVIANLLVNAVEAAGAGGEVSVSVVTEGPEVGLAVRDTGPGIADDVRARVCEPFFTTKRGGVGLGLAIAQAIVDAHGGRLSFTRPAEGGTRSIVYLPVAQTGRAHH